MKHRITAAIVAAAIAITTAAPARADNNDLLKMTIGAIGVGLLVHELDKKNREEIRNASDNEWSDDRWSNERRPYDGYGSAYRHKGKIIPAQCVFDGKVRGRWREVVSSRCMSEFGAARRLPGECRVEVKARGDRRHAYGLHCLQDRGYRVAWSRR